MNTITYPYLIFIILLLITLPNLTGCEEQIPGAPPKPLPVLGKDPIPDLLNVEDHGQALARWAEQGLRDAVVINIDTHDDIRVIPEEKITELQKLYKQQDWKEFAEADSVADHGLYHVGNWIYAGARLGMFKEIFWVIPYPYFSQSNAEELLRRFLKDAMFSDEDIQTYTLQDNRFSGFYQGIPLTVCDIESLPVLSHHVVMSIDTDFFPVFSTQYRINYLKALDILFSSLFNRNYHIQKAVVSYSVNGEYISPHLRWIGDELANVLSRPSVLNEPPSDLLVQLQKLDDEYRSVQHEKMLRLIEEYPTADHEASLLLYKAYAHMLKGETEKAFNAAKSSCEADRLYCTGLSYLGSLYFTKKQCQEAERFFMEGYSSDPGIINGLYYYAHCLRDMGKTDEALRYYRKDVQMNGSFPTNFLIFETYLLSGNSEEAVQALNAAVSSLEINPYAEVVNTRAANAIYAALDYSEKNNLMELHAVLKDNPAVKKMFVDYPKK